MTILNSVPLRQFATSLLISLDEKNHLRILPTEPKILLLNFD